MSGPCSIWPPFGGFWVKCVVTPSKEKALRSMRDGRAEYVKHHQHASRGAGPEGRRQLSARASCSALLITFVEISEPATEVWWTEALSDLNPASADTIQKLRELDPCRFGRNTNPTSITHVIANVPLGSGDTLYRRFGDYFAWACIALAIALITLSYRSWVRKKAL